MIVRANLACTGTLDHINILHWEVLQRYITTQNMTAKRISKRIANRIDVLFRVVLKEIVDGVMSISQERIQHRTVGEIMDVPVPQIQGLSVAVPASSCDVGTNKEFTSNDQGQAHSRESLQCPPRSHEWHNGLDHR